MAERRWRRRGRSGGGDEGERRQLGQRDRRRARRAPGARAGCTPATARGAECQRRRRANRIAAGLARGCKARMAAARSDLLTIEACLDEASRLAPEGDPSMRTLSICAVAAASLFAGRDRVRPQDAARPNTAPDGDGYPGYPPPGQYPPGAAATRRAAPAVRPLPTYARRVSAGVRTVRSRAHRPAADGHPRSARVPLPERRAVRHAPLQHAVRQVRLPVPVGGRLHPRPTSAWPGLCIPTPPAH